LREETENVLEALLKIFIEKELIADRVLGILSFILSTSDESVVHSPAFLQNNLLSKTMRTESVQMMSYYAVMTVTRPVLDIHLIAFAAVLISIPPLIHLHPNHSRVVLDVIRSRTRMISVGMVGRPPLLHLHHHQICLIGYYH
jgi:hypothetical protein